MPPSPLLIDAILAFANESDEPTRKRLVERHRASLLGDDVDAALEGAIAHNAQRPEVRERFEHVRRVLADCRAIGIDAAFVFSIGPTPGLLDALKDLLGADSAAAARDVTVRQQALLLTDEADWVLAALAHETPEETFFVERVAHRRALLARCRSEGIEPAFADLLRDEGIADVQTASQVSLKAATLRQEQARKEEVFASVQEAVAAALRMQAEDGFDLFRGQRRAWPVVSSYRRLDPDQQADAKARVNRFIHWAKTEPALVPYGFDSDQAIAVAQHYGIATTFLDFSTEVDVARYFATEHCFEPKQRSAAEQEALSCIVAVRSADLAAWVKRRFRQTGKFLGPEILRLDVPNLWRIEAQAGVFLVDDEVIDDYPFHCLLFPASLGPEPSRVRATVYPEKKSDLELILDQWFWHEKASAGTSRLYEMLEQAGVAPQRITTEPTDGIGFTGIRRPAPHPSWSGREATWLHATERFHAVRARPEDVFEIDLPSRTSLDAVRSLVAALLPPDSLAGRRRRSANWRVRVDGSVERDAGDKLSRQWDALRIDGYTDAQVAASFAASISMLALQLGLVEGWLPYGGALGIQKDTEPLASLFGADLLVEFTGQVGYSRALLSAADLRSAVRDDVGSYLPDDFFEDCGPTTAERMRQLLIGIHSPSLLFDFDRFADVYVRQVVPTSLVFRPDLPLYPVLHLRNFGVP